MSLPNVQSVEQALANLIPDRYLLYRTFWMPKKHGSVLAIAVQNGVAQQLQSLYTLMLQTIVTEVWIITLLVVMGLLMRRKPESSKNVGVANVAIWNQKSSPSSVAASMLGYQRHIRGYAAMWALLALVALGGQKVLSTFISPFLILGDAAPVNPRAVFVPTPVLNASDYSSTLMYHILIDPANQRAVNTLDGVDPFTGSLVNFNSTTNHAVSFSSSPARLINGSDVFVEFNYSYRISGVDFGLQKLSDLHYIVEGSCHTDYTWYQGPSDSGGDTYSVPGYGLRTVSALAAQANPPVVSVFNLSPNTLHPPTNSTFNYTFAFVVSSINRTSYTSSVDPWYRTDILDPSKGTYTVARGRPVLLCWEVDIWSYRGTNMSTKNFTSDYLFPSAIQTIIDTFLSMPKIIDLGTHLGVLALQSATASSLSAYFDAGSSFLLKDMQRLVYASYIAAKNTFVETTVSNHASYPAYPANTANQNSLVDPTTNKLLDGAGDFVVYGNGIAALSVTFIVVIPIVLFVLLAIVYLFSTNRWYQWPWASLNALNATILYSTIDSKHFRDSDEPTWTRVSTSPFHATNERSHVRPRYDRASRSYGWSISSE